MNSELLYLTIVLLSLLILILVAAVAFLAYKVFQQKETKMEPADQGHGDAYVESCIYHPERQAQGLCAISQDPICENCIREDDGLIISAEHFRTYLQAQWVSIENVRATPDDTLASSHIYTFKGQIWSKEQIPTLIRTHYKIDVETDQIESHIQFLVREDEQEDLKKRLEQHKMELVRS